MTSYILGAVNQLGDNACYNLLGGEFGIWNLENDTCRNKIWLSQIIAKLFLSF